MPTLFANSIKKYLSWRIQSSYVFLEIYHLLKQDFCGAEGIENVLTLSDFATGQFGIDYGLRITSGPLKDLNSRAVIILDENKEVVYTEQVSEIANEPNYKAAVKALS